MRFKNALVTIISIGSCACAACLLLPDLLQNDVCQCALLIRLRTRCLQNGHSKVTQGAGWPCQRMLQQIGG